MEVNNKPFWKGGDGMKKVFFKFLKTTSQQLQNRVPNSELRSVEKFQAAEMWPFSSQTSNNQKKTEKSPPVCQQISPTTKIPHCDWKSVGDSSTLPQTNK